MAFGICYVLGCNYRNVTVTYLNGDATSKQDFAYTVVFYVQPGSANITAYPAALIALLPSASPTTVGTIAYGMYFTQGGALSTLTGVYPATSYTFPAALPPMPPLPPPITPPPPPALPPPPPPAAPCTCTNGYSGVDCSVSP